MTRSKALALTLLLFAGQSIAQPAIDFKGVALGSAVDAVKAIGPVTCKDDPRRLFDAVCALADSTSTTYANMPVRAVEFRFIQGQLQWIEVEQGVEALPSVSIAIMNKFGQDKCIVQRTRPTGTKTSCYVSQASAKLTLSQDFADVFRVVIRGGPMDAEFERRLKAMAPSKPDI